MTELVTRIVLAAAYLSVIWNLWHHRQQIRDAMWPAAILTAGVGALWGTWYTILAFTEGPDAEFVIGFTRALHFPSVGLLHFLILMAFRRPSAVVS